MAAYLRYALDHLEEFAGTAIQGAEMLASCARDRLKNKLQGGTPGWLKAVTELPSAPAVYQLHQDTLTVTSPREVDSCRLRSCLMRLHPWRKGPFSLFGTRIDSEWRADWKWRRLLPHLTSLSGRSVLDLGCGNGYYCLRTRGAGARLVVGADPSQLFLAQFLAVRRYIPEPVYLLPLGSEQLGPTGGFDTVLSMGILYHRRSPLDHLRELRALVRSGGELALETLVVEGGRESVLVPAGRYAQMRNVWSLPSALALESWLDKAGFTHIRLADVTFTGRQEQRPTDWMRFQSLQHFLAADGSRTLEGHPRPTRALFIAQLP